jgi:hypothetical protein
MSQNIFITMNKLSEMLFENHSLVTKQNNKYGGGVMWPGGYNRWLYAPSFYKEETIVFDDELNVVERIPNINEVLEIAERRAKTFATLYSAEVEVVGFDHKTGSISIGIKGNSYAHLVIPDSFVNAFLANH